MPRITTAIPEIAWPAVPQAPDTLILSLLYQFARTERMPRARLLARQLEQAARLIEHARLTVPYYRDRLPVVNARLSMREFRRIPILTRAQIQQAGRAIQSTRLPPDHEPCEISETSGSTGRPVRVLETYPTKLFQTAFNWRNYLWHGLELDSKAGAIRHFGNGKHGSESRTPTWGTTFQTGELVRLDVSAAVDEQLEWLERERPRYLVCYPSMLGELARRCEARGRGLPFIERFMTFGEALTSELRMQCARVFEVGVIDCYSSMECGFLALQCPQHEHYHVMAESVLLEVLDEYDQPCRAGQQGRVVITVLHNFATPLIRYDIGDIAQVGRSCPCGRGLPVLTRVLGRTRNLLRLANGSRRWPIYSSMKILAGTPVTQFQLAQTSLDTIEARLVVPRSMTETEIHRFEQALLAQLRHPFRIEYKFVDEIPRGPSGKYDDFRCEIDYPHAA